VHYLNEKVYLEAAQGFHWATKEHFSRFLTGTDERHRRTEIVLPRLVKKGKIAVRRHGKRYVYAALSKKNNQDIEHGLACTEGLVRFWLSRNEATIIPEKRFRGFGIVPEWGLKYPNGKLLLYEHCTYDNFKRKRVVKTKVNRYWEFLPNIESRFASESIVVFVADVSRMHLEEFIRGNLFEGSFFFTDYQTFLQIRIGDQLTAPIYIWSEDAHSYPLTHAND